jgi:hypothetical protein
MPITINGSTGISGVDGSAGTPAVIGSDADTGLVFSAGRVQASLNGIAANVGLVQGTAQNSTSGTVVDFTGVPSWARRITVMLNGVSTSGTSSLLFQLGTSGGVQTTGYTTANTRIGASAVIAASSTAGWAVNSATAASTSSGHAVFTFVQTGVWVGSCMIGSSEPAVSWITGRKDLSGTLDRVRVTTVNGTDTFDAGSINILYE